MYILLIVVFTIISLFLDMINPKRTKPILLIFLLPIMMFNFSNQDYYTYKYAFENSDVNQIMDSGFKYYMELFHAIGFTNYQVIPISLGIFVAFTFIRLSKYIRQTNFILLLYFIFPFLVDVIQIRNTFMMFMVINAMLTYSEGKRIRSFVWLALGSSFHAFGYLTIMFFLLIEIIRLRSPKNDRKLVPDFFEDKNKKINLLIILLSAFGFFGGPFFLKVATKILPPIAATKILYYQSAGLNMDSLIWGIFLILDLIIFYYYLKHIRSRNEEIKNDNLLNFLFYFIFMGVLVISLLLYFHEINRFFRMLFISKYILYGAMAKYLYRKERITLMIYLVIISLFMSFIYYRGGIDYDHIIVFNQLWNK